MVINQMFTPRSGVYQAQHPQGWSAISFPCGPTCNGTLIHSVGACLSKRRARRSCQRSLLETGEPFAFHLLRMHPGSQRVALSVTSGESTHSCTGPCRGVTFRACLHACSAGLLSVCLVAPQNGSGRGVPGTIRRALHTAPFPPLSVVIHLSAPFVLPGMVCHPDPPALFVSASPCAPAALPFCCSRASALGPPLAPAFSCALTTSIPACLTLWADLGLMVTGSPRPQLRHPKCGEGLLGGLRSTITDFAPVPPQGCHH